MVVLDAVEAEVELDVKRRCFVLFLLPLYFGRVSIDSILWSNFLDPLAHFLSKAAISSPFRLLAKVVVTQVDSRNVDNNM